jgi:hypothetical protein
MRTRLAALIAMAFVTTAYAQLQVGQKLQTHLAEKQVSAYCAVTPSQIYPCVNLKLRGISFVVGYERDTHVIKYVSTKDEKFETKEGLRVGSEIEVRSDQLHLFDGWEILGPVTSDGWRIQLGAWSMSDSGQLSFGRLQFTDGTVIDLAHPPKSPKQGRVKIFGFEKGGVLG